MQFLIKQTNLQNKLTTAVKDDIHTKLATALFWKQLGTYFIFRFISNK